MKGRDHHAALKTEVVASASGPLIQAKVARLFWGKNDFALSLHVRPGSYTTSGLQTTDLLGYLGFERKPCAFVDKRECYCCWVGHDFPLEKFVAAFAESYNALCQADRHFEACGFFVGQPEGWSYFQGGRLRGEPARFGSQTTGDGHTSPVTELMKTAEDENFRFAFSWLEGGGDKGWTTHYRPKHLPLSPEIAGAFDFLELKGFNDCTVFDFEPCRWRFTARESRGSSPFDNNAEVAHGWFNAHATHFSEGIRQLLAAQKAVQPFGMYFLPLRGTHEERIKAELDRRVLWSVNRGSAPKRPYRYDVAISFAGTERTYAEALSKAIQDAG
jgi:hypothetical protein